MSVEITFFKVTCTRIFFSVFIPGVPELWSQVCILNAQCIHHTDVNPILCEC